MRGAFALICLASLLPASSFVFGQEPAAAAADAAEAPRIPAEQLDSLVAPIALYPDELLGQTLVASTYPLEIIQLQQWLDRNKGLKDEALAEALMKQPWDPSIQAMAAVPEVVRRLAENIQWTTELGNAFLAQQEDVFAAVQRMRAKAQGTGALVTNQQQVVETQTVGTGDEAQQVIVVQQAKPEVIYVPSYDPVVVYGAPPPAYPYPSYIYAGYVPGMALAWGAGFVLGATWGGCWGYNCGWGGGDVNINYNNSFTRNTAINTGNIGSGNVGKWEHRPEHRGGAPYRDHRTADRFGGRGPGQRPGGIGGIGGVGGIGKPGGVGGVGSPGGIGSRPGSGIGSKPGIGSGAGTRPSTQPSTRPSTRPSTQPSTRPSTRPTTRPSTQPASRSIGSRSVSPSPSRSAFGGSGSAARASSSRGASSMGRAPSRSAPSRSAPSRGGGGGRRR
ncbi:MAG: DUF3300 domain-containing protein [Akkermansiaceae bacterium]|nr:DUF3300 domain-containing protein [Akkermansiaceae bacterium]